MKVMTMESSAFQALTEQIAEIAAHVRKSNQEKQEPAADRLLDTNETARLLNVSKRTLQRMRDEHRIEFVVLRGKCRYRLSEEMRLFDNQDMCVLLGFAIRWNGGTETERRAKMKQKLRYSNNL